MSEAEGVVELAAGIGEAREVVEFVGREKLSRALFRAKVDKSESGALRFDLRAKFGQLGDRLATECSTEVAEEDQQQRPA